MVDQPNERTRVSIFYSWQSDLPDKANRSAIRLALKVVVPLVVV